MEKDQMFDAAPPDDYIKQIVASCEESNFETYKRFSEEHSRDFYLGMIAAQRVLFGFMLTCSSDDLINVTLRLGIDAAFIANRKTNPQ